MWRVANSLLKLREQVNELVPNRSKLDDGTIGDASHQSRTSDHNPWVNDGEMGVVTAMDLTHDPRNGFDSYQFADNLKLQHDPRIKYVISNRRIWTPSISNEWRAYNGANPHDRHVHVSVRSTKSFYDDTTDWVIGHLQPNPNANPVEARPRLQQGATGSDVSYLQTLLDIDVDGVFGPDTDKAVRSFQAEHGLLVDGVVGSRTWEALIGGPQPVMEGICKNIMATVFGGSSEHEMSAYDGDRINDHEMSVALPARFPGKRPKIKVTNPHNGRHAIAEIRDVGPWNTNDPYWEPPGHRPQAESGKDLRKRRTNLAGIDLSPALANALGIEGMGRVDWEFVKD